MDVHCTPAILHCTYVWLLIRLYSEIRGLRGRDPQRTSLPPIVLRVTELSKKLSEDCVRSLVFKNMLLIVLLVLLLICLGLEIVLLSGVCYIIQQDRCGGLRWLAATHGTTSPNIYETVESLWTPQIADGGSVVTVGESSTVGADFKIKDGSEGVEPDWWSRKYVKVDSDVEFRVPSQSLAETKETSGDISFDVRPLREVQTLNPRCKETGVDASGLFDWTPLRGDQVPSPVVSVVHERNVGSNPFISDTPSAPDAEKKQHCESLSFDTRSPSMTGGMPAADSSRQGRALSAEERYKFCWGEWTENFELDPGSSPPKYNGKVP